MSLITSINPNNPNDPDIINYPGKNDNSNNFNKYQGIWEQRHNFVGHMGTVGKCTSNRENRERNRLRQREWCLAQHVYLWTFTPKLILCFAHLLFLLPPLPPFLPSNRLSFPHRRYIPLYNNNNRATCACVIVWVGTPLRMNPRWCVWGVKLARRI